jgi:hypothetical protein
MRIADLQPPLVNSFKTVGASDDEPFGAWRCSMTIEGAARTSEAKQERTKSFMAAKEGGLLLKECVFSGMNVLVSSFNALTENGSAKT